MNETKFAEAHCEAEVYPPKRCEVAMCIDTKNNRMMCFNHPTPPPPVTAHTHTLSLHFHSVRLSNLSLPSVLPSAPLPSHVVVLSQPVIWYDVARLTSLHTPSHIHVRFT